MWWYRDRKDQAEGDDASSAKTPTDRLAAALSPVVRDLQAEPDLLLVMVLLVEKRVTLDGGDQIGELTWAEAETLLSAACGAPRRLYNAFARDFGEADARGAGMAPGLRERYDELRTAIAAAPGISAVGA